MEWQKPKIIASKVRHFDGPIDAMLTAEGAAADVLAGTGALAEEAEKLFWQALAFLKRQRKR